MLTWNNDEKFRKISDRVISIYPKAGEKLLKQIKGIEALVEMLCWHEGHFTFEDGLTTKETNIGCD